MDKDTIKISDEVKPKSVWYYSRKRFKRNKFAMIGLIVLTVLILSAISADLIAPYEPDSQVLEFTSKPMFFKGIVIIKKSIDKDILKKIIPVKKVITEDSEKVFYIDYNNKEQSILKSELDDKKISKELLFICGTDRFGRDVLSRLIYGSRVSLSVGVISETIAILIGIFLGALSGYYRGISDKFILWLINVVWAFPSILFVIALSVVLGKGYWQAFVAIGVSGWVDIARIVRGQFITLRESEFVEASKVAGFGSFRIIFKHILPNCFGSISIAGTVGLATAIIFESSLSFLGLGVQPPTASWGQMLFDGYKYIIAGSHLWLAILPASLIFITVLSVNLVGDGLRDALDPKLKR